MNFYKVHYFVRNNFGLRTFNRGSWGGQMSLKTEGDTIINKFIPELDGEVSQKQMGRIASLDLLSG